MKSARHIFGVCCTCWLLSLACSSLAADIELLKCIPKNDEIAGWVRDGETYVATDEESLAGFINGAAPFYIEHGAVEVGFQDYVKEDVYLTLEIYRMKDEESAKQLYADISAENPETLENIRGKGRFVGGLVGVYLIEYWQNAFFVRLTVAEKSAASKETILEFARMVSEKIHASGKQGKKSRS